MLSDIWIQHSYTQRTTQAKNCVSREGDARSFMLFSLLQRTPIECLTHDVCPWWRLLGGGGSTASCHRIINHPNSNKLPFHRRVLGIVVVLSLLRRELGNANSVVDTLGHTFCLFPFGAERSGERPAVPVSDHCGAVYEPHSVISSLPCS